MSKRPPGSAPRRPSPERNRKPGAYDLLPDSEIPEEHREPLVVTDTSLQSRKMEKLARLVADAGNTGVPIWPDLAKAAGYQTYEDERYTSQYRGKRKYEFKRSVLLSDRFQARVRELRGDIRATETPKGGDAMRDEVLASLREVRDYSLKMRPRDLTAANRANELIGKSIGMFQEVHRQADPFDEMSPEELEKTIIALLKDPIIRGMVKRAVEKYEVVEKEAVTAPQPQPQPSPVH